MNTNKKPIIEAKNIYKSFQVGKGEVEVLKDINLEIYSGEFVVIFGPSGCGKSTLLNTLVGLEQPTNGNLYVRGTDVYHDLSLDERAVFRSKKFGIVHQQANWIKSLNIIENIIFPLAVMGKSEKKSYARADELLKLFRLEEFEQNTPTELSGGQQQRVSVVRSLITNPWIIIADEPTGNLDTAAAADLMYIFQFLNADSKRTIIMVTHNPDYDKYATRIIKMEDGRIISTKVKKRVSIDDEETKSDILTGRKEGAQI